jgi:hypothetical protein
MNIIQRINIANNENRRNKFINAIFTFFEINIIICFLICALNQKNKLNIWIKHRSNKNKNINDHRFLDIKDNLTISSYYIGILLNNMNLTKVTELNDELYSDSKNKSIFNISEEDYLLNQLLDMLIYDIYFGKIDKAYFK